MGWASMNEDNESRYFNATIVRNEVDRQMNTPTSKAPKTASPTKLAAFASPQARSLPVIILADVSGSMSEKGKIEAMNLAIKQMVASFGKESHLRADIQVGLITFGGEDAKFHLPLVSAQSVSGIEDFKATGRTPMGAAFELARQALEDKERIPARAYRPILILVSDGAPTDDWEAPLERLKKGERAQKATRISVAIGADADRELLKLFANHAEVPVFEAHEASDIRRFFRAVTMSVVAHSASATPDNRLVLEIGDLPKDDLDMDVL